MKKKILSVILALAIVLPLCPVIELPVFAAQTSGTTGDCTWTLDGTKLTISGNGAMGDYTIKDVNDSWVTTAPWGPSVTKVIIENGVTSIGYSAFYGCTSLTAITIPDGVTSIGSSAFHGCTGLTTVTIPDGVTSIGSSAFYGCTGLTAITIPDGVTSIGSSAFYGCTGLTTVTIPDGVTSIGEGAFSYCTGLTTITIPDSVTSIGDYAFFDCDSLTSVTIPDGVTSIGSFTFDSCLSLTSVTIPDSVTTIGDAAFSCCNSLTSVTIPDSVTTIGFSAFDGCSSLTSVTIPDGVTSIGSYAFYGCTGLTSVSIGNSVTSIGDWTFSGCSALAHVWLVGDEASKNLITLGIGNTALTNALWHYVDAACDGECNECGATRTHSDHVYDGICDGECNECGLVRIVPDHVFDNACDATCNVCGALRTVPDHVYDSSFDATCNECGFIREALATISACMNLSVEERIYLNLWLDAEGIAAYKAEEGEDFTYEAFVTVDGEKKILGSGKVVGDPTETAYGSYYVIRLSALPANYFDQTITVESPAFTINTVGDLPLNLLNLAKAGAEAGYDVEKTNLFKAIYNYGASAAGLDLLDMVVGFLREQAADPIYGIRAHDAVRFTGMQLLMGDAVGIRLLGKATGDITGLSLGLNLGGSAVDDPTYALNVDEEGNLTLDLYVSAENYLSLLDVTVSVDDYAVLRLKTSVKGYTEWANKGTDDRTLALAQLVQACVNANGDHSYVIPDHSGIETPDEAGEIIF